MLFSGRVVFFINAVVDVNEMDPTYYRLNIVERGRGESNVTANSNQHGGGVTSKRNRTEVQVNPNRSRHAIEEARASTRRAGSRGQKPPVEEAFVASAKFTHEHQWIGWVRGRG